MKTPGQGEVCYRKLDATRQSLFDAARAAEFKSLLETGAIRICSMAESRVVQRDMSDRIIPSRWVDRDKPGDAVGEPTKYKSRWTLQGFRDPDILEVTTASPTPASGAVTAALQFCSSSNFEVHIGDVKTAFLQGLRLEREKGPLFATQPSDGLMPGLEQGQLVELLKDVYGLNSAPASWRRALKRFLVELGYVESALDPCVYLLPSSQNKSWSTVTRGATRFVMPRDIPRDECKTRVSIDMCTGRVIEARELHSKDKDLEGPIAAGPTDILTIVGHGPRGLEAERCQGLIVVEVDDILSGGPRDSQSAHAQNMSRLQERFKFGKWQGIQSGSMYIGRQIREDRGGIYMSWEKYIRECVSEIDLSKERLRDVKSPLTEAEIRFLRGALGSVGWVAREGRFEVSGVHSLVASAFPNPCVQDIVDINRAIKHLKNTASLEICLQRIPLNAATVVAFSDAALCNADAQRSQGGWILGLAEECIGDDNEARISIIAGRSQKIRRVCASSLTAETYAFGIAIGEVEWYTNFLSELCGAHIVQGRMIGHMVKTQVIGRRPSSVVTDAKSLFDQLSKESSTATLADKRCAVELAAIRQTLDLLKTRVRWVPHHRMIADALTKRVGNLSSLVELLRSGCVTLTEESRELKDRREQRQVHGSISRPHRWGTL
eukprot:626637-Amphidinium_carterae.1